MIYVSAQYADAGHETVTGTDANGATETAPAEHTVFRCPDDGPSGFIANGGVIEDYEAPPVPMPSLEPWQFFAMLDLSGKRADLDAFIEAMPEPNKTVARAKLERSLVFYRDNDLVLAAQQALSLTNAELDALWLQAKAL
jgi:hypothetical protein